MEFKRFSTGCYPLIGPLFCKPIYFGHLSTVVPANSSGDDVFVDKCLKLHQYHSDLFWTFVDGVPANSSGDDVFVDKCLKLH